MVSVVIRDPRRDGVRQCATLRGSDAGLERVSNDRTREPEASWQRESPTQVAGSHRRSLKIVISVQCLADGSHQFAHAKGLCEQTVPTALQVFPALEGWGIPTHEDGALSRVDFQHLEHHLRA